MLRYWVRRCSLTIGPIVVQKTKFVFISKKRTIAVIFQLAIIKIFQLIWVEWKKMCSSWNTTNVTLNIYQAVQANNIFYILSFHPVLVIPTNCVSILQGTEIQAHLPKRVGWLCPVRSALKRTPVEDLNSFSIMFNYIISTTYQKIRELFCPVIFLDFNILAESFYDDN